jgi:hypothetical protein
MRKYMSIVLVIVLCLSFVGCGEKKTETQETEISEAETETSEVTDLPEEEELFYPWIIGNAEFMVPTGVIPSNMVEGDVEYCTFQVGDLFVLVSAIPQEGRFSLSDFEKEDADAYLNELMEPDEYGYAPATGELIIAGEIPYYMLGYSYEDTGSWIMFYTILDGMAYNFCGWRPNDTVVETDVEFLWGTASTLNSLLAELEEEVDGE